MLTFIHPTPPHTPHHTTYTGQGIAAQAYRLGELNKETAYVLHTLGLEVRCGSNCGLDLGLGLGFGLEVRFSPNCGLELGFGFGLVVRCSSIVPVFARRRNSFRSHPCLQSIQRCDRVHGQRPVVVGVSHSDPLPC
jgi:hypothetical protein